MRRNGFTLIELLIVIAIIAILASILFPVFARAREAARRSACASNLKNLTMALRMYSSDYDERLPQGIPTVPTCPPGAPFVGPSGWCNGPQSFDGTTATSTLAVAEYMSGWAFMASSYIKNTQILLCPNYANPPYVHVPFLQGVGADRWVTSYQMSSCLVGAHEAELQNAANKALLYDLFAYHSGMRLDVLGGPDPSNRGQQMDTNNPKPSQIENVAFADGHVKSVNMDKAIGDTTVAGCCDPATCNSGAALHPITGQPSGKSGPANKWSLSSGWNPASAPNYGCSALVNPSPYGQSGRQGANF